MSSPLHLEIKIEKGPDAVSAHRFQSSIIKIGRGLDNDLPLPQDPKVSRVHAEIQQIGSELYLINVSQKNTLLLNGQKIQREKITHGSRIQMGESLLWIQILDLAKNPSPQDLAPQSMNQEKIKSSLPGGVPSQTHGYNSPQVFNGMAPSKNPSGNRDKSLPQAASPYQGNRLNSSAAKNQPSNAPPQFGTNPLASSTQNEFQKSSTPSKKKNFYILMILLLAGFLFLLTQDKKPKNAKDPNALKSQIEVLKQIKDSEKSIEKLKEEVQKKESHSIRRAQENAVRAFRDFNQGQYGRAIEGFQVVLNLDPENELAKRYYNLSKVRLDQRVKELLLQGMRYKEKGNWRLCSDSFGKAMILLQGKRDDTQYTQAKKNREECNLEMEGRY